VHPERAANRAQDHAYDSVAHGEAAARGINRWTKDGSMVGPVRRRGMLAAAIECSNLVLCILG